MAAAWTNLRPWGTRSSALVLSLLWVTAALATPSLADAVANIAAPVESRAAILQAERDASRDTRVEGPARLQWLYEERPDLSPGADLQRYDEWRSQIAVVFETEMDEVSAATAPHDAVHGNLGRNSLRGFSNWQTDLGLHKRFAITETVGIQIRGEFFNLLNEPNFAPPANNLANAQFGRSTQMLNRSIGGLNALYQIGGPRSVQLGLRLEF